MSNTRRAQGKVSVKAAGVVYLLHFHERLGTQKHSIQHYLGFTPDLEARLEKHRNGQGARITEVLKERGIGFDVAAVWPGNKQIENALKLHSATRICPQCTPSPRIPLLVRKAIEAEGRRQAREARKEARRAREAHQYAEAVAAARADPYQRGADMAERFIRDQASAGRTAEQIAATYAFITGPWHERGHHTAAQAETFRGYSEMVTAALVQLREPQAAAQPREGTEMSTGTAPETPPVKSATEWIKGARTAHDLIVRQVEAGHSPDRIAERWEQALATYDDATATPAQREWHAGAEETARDMIQTWRDIQRAEAEQAQAAKDTAEAEMEAEAG